MLEWLRKWWDGPAAREPSIAPGDPPTAPFTGRIAWDTGWIEYVNGICTGACSGYSGPEVTAGDPPPAISLAEAIARARGSSEPPAFRVAFASGPFDGFCDWCGKRGVCRLEGARFRCGCGLETPVPTGGAVASVAGDPVFPDPDSEYASRISQLTAAKRLENTIRGIKES